MHVHEGDTGQDSVVRPGQSPVGTLIWPQTQIAGGRRPKTIDQLAD